LLFNDEESVFPLLRTTLFGDDSLPCGNEMAVVGMDNGIRLCISWLAYDFNIKRFEGTCEISARLNLMKAVDKTCFLLIGG
ncbi:4632_t:CDS:2, partial [Acaulospora morrowiae]